MWKDEGYLASGEKLVSSSLNVFSVASKAFGHASKPFSHASKLFNHVSKPFSHASKLFNHVSKMSTHAFNKRLVKGRCSINGIFMIFLLNQLSGIKLHLF